MCFVCVGDIRGMLRGLAVKENIIEEAFFFTCVGIKPSNSGDPLKLYDTKQ